MAGFFQQLKALLWRNVMLKRRNRAKLYQELLSPVFFVAILAATKSGIESHTLPSRTFSPQDVNSEDFGVHFTNKTLIYGTPNTTKYNLWMQEVVKQLNGPPEFKLFSSESDLEEAYKMNRKNVDFSVVFDYEGDQNAYVIRTDPRVVPSTSDSFDLSRGSCRKDGNSTSSDSCSVNKYMTSGFLHLQIAIDNMLMTNLGVPKSAISSRKTYVQLMDLDDLAPDSSGIQAMSSIYLVLSFCLLANYLVVNIVSEKEKKIKDGMLMMGLNPNVFWLSWSITYFVMVIISAGLMIAIMSLTHFFENSNLFLLFVMIVLYGTSFIALGFMITPFFNKAKVAGAVASFSTILLSLLNLAVTQTRDKYSYDANVPAWSQWLMCLISPIAFANCMDKAVYLDIRKNGFDFGDSMTYGKFPLYAPITMLLVDTVLYALLTVYFDKVIPGEYGVRYKPYFFLQYSYWFPQTSHSETQRLVTNTNGAQRYADIESVPEDLSRHLAMKISSISKSFEADGKVTNALRDFSLDIYEGQITCLLGHNGAGKTTLMNILTGVLPPSSGSATIIGLNVTVPAEMQLIRKKCGICPQHNILFDELSCKEHLRIFADIKGVPEHHRDDAVRQSLRDVDLGSQEDTLAKNLSGGQKRKLCVAIALIGDPKLVFLDEPTAGMDPFSRRHLWSLLKKSKKRRVIVLTTHFMDEADILSDRKAFIRNGRLQCCGSSLFLKNKFGVGYHLTLVAEPMCDVNNLTNFFTQIVPGIQYDRSHGKEIAYTLPISDVSNFPVLFRKLDEKSEMLGIKSYGVSMTTLEEVFLKLEDVGRENEAEDDDVIGDINKETSPRDEESVKVDIDSGLFSTNLITDKLELAKRQFSALLWLRFLMMMRSKKLLFVQLVLPVLLMVAGIVLVKTSNLQTVTDNQEPGLNISLKYYANSSMISFGPRLPGLMILDSIQNNASRAVISDWAQDYSIDSYPPNTETSEVEPHHVGVHLRGMTGLYLTDSVSLYNHTALHSVPATVSLVTQGMLHASGIAEAIRTTSFPWPRQEVDERNFNTNVMFAGLVIGLSFVLIIPGFSSEIVRDRETKVRGQLRISGVGFHAYWGSIYTMNFAVYLIPTITMLIITLALQIPGLDSAGAIVAIALLMLLNIPFLCFFALIISFLFSKADSCSSYLPVLLNWSCILPYIVISILGMSGYDNLSIILHYVFCIIDPPYIVLGGFFFIEKVSMMAAFEGRQEKDADYFDFNNHTLIAIVMPVIHMLWMYWLLKILDTLKMGGTIREAFPCCSKASNTITKLNTDTVQSEDSDVQAERSRIDAMDHHLTQEPVAYAKQIRKTFEKRTTNKKARGRFSCCLDRDENKKVAVRNLTFGVDEGEILGLLGPNGAGKTTALNMIIAETKPTCGQVVVRGHDIRSNLFNSTCLGYCPQHDALWEGVTLKEHIVCFAAIKGVDYDDMEKLVDYYVSNMKLEDHKDKRSRNLSGGTKRKLSYILSILGDPDLVLMDEPSTGMDPQSKRFLWDTVSATFRNTSKGAILTTHYMEEADALCNRVGIMVNGELQCIGSTQHLKNKYGSGYILELKLKVTESNRIEDEMDGLENHLRELFPDMQRVERFMERAQYAIPKENVKSLGRSFAALENCKESHHLEEYSFSQSSLEQVFLYFAKKQKEETEDDD